MYLLIRIICVYHQPQGYFIRRKNNLFTRNDIKLLT